MNLNTNDMTLSNFFRLENMEKDIDSASYDSALL